MKRESIKLFVMQQVPTHSRFPATFEFLLDFTKFKYDTFLHLYPLPQKELYDMQKHNLKNAIINILVYCFYENKL